LFYGPFRVLSQVGPQQGHPVGPLFVLQYGTTPLLNSREILLTLGYLDDFTFGGPAEVVALARDVSKVVEIGGELCLSLNVSTCELVSHDGFTVTDSLLQSFPRTCIVDVTLLGAPLFPGPSLDRA